jgi:hypothetical protein
MSVAMERSKESLSDLEKHYVTQDGIIFDEDVLKNMASYFLGNDQETEDVQKEFGTGNNKSDDYGDDDSMYDSEDDEEPVITARTTATAGTAKTTGNAATAKKTDDINTDDKQTDGNNSDDDDSTLSEDEDDDTLGSKMIAFWNSRKKKLISDVAITAWMVSPLPEIMEDVKTHDGEDRNAVERLIKKWFSITVSVVN